MTPDPKSLLHGRRLLDSIASSVHDAHASLSDADLATHRGQAVTHLIMLVRGQDVFIDDSSSASRDEFNRCLNSVLHLCLLTYADIVHRRSTTP